MDSAAVGTQRLVLRPWQDSDREPFAALNADPQVMEHFPSVLTRAESDAVVDRFLERFETHGLSMWAAELRADGRFIGFVGLNPVPPTLPFDHDGFEVGWRLATAYWGHGYASEGARAALDYGFNRLDLREVVSFTATTNVRSQAVMRRIGMVRDEAADFDHPRVPPGHRLARHVLFRIDATAYRRIAAEPAT